MALVNCPECGVSISSAAQSCPRCAHPMNQSGMRAGKFAPVHTGRVITTERTGKNLKAEALLANLLIVAAFTVLLTFWIGEKTTPPMPRKLILWGSGMLLFGAAWKVRVRVLTWWRHA